MPRADPLTLQTRHFTQNVLLLLDGTSDACRAGLTRSALTLWARICRASATEERLARRAAGEAYSALGDALDVLGWMLGAGASPARVSVLLRDGRALARAIEVRWLTSQSRGQPVGGPPLARSTAGSKDITSELLSSATDSIWPESGTLRAGVMQQSLLELR